MPVISVLLSAYLSNALQKQALVGGPKGSQAINPANKRYPNHLANPEAKVE